MKSLPSWSRLAAFSVLLALLSAGSSFFYLLPAQSGAVPTAPSDDNPDAADQEGLDAFPTKIRARPSVYRKKGVPETGPTADQRAMAADNCLFGMPRRTPGTNLGPSRFVYRRGYVLEHSSTDRIPLWVAEHSTREELSGSLPRTNPFAPDPQLSGFPRAELPDYRGSGFDRGHMAPNGNQTVDDTQRRETFYLSNIVPQVGREFNQSIWAELEGMVRKWTRRRGESWIITGTLFFDLAEENPATADGMVEHQTIGDNEVAVPTHLFKIVVAKSQGSNQWESIAFVMENRRHSKPFEFSSYLVSIDWIEERSGLDYMPEIVAQTSDPALEQRLEGTVAQLWAD